MVPSGVATNPVNHVDLPFNVGVDPASLAVSNFLVTSPVPGFCLQISAIPVTPAGGPVVRVSFPAQSALGIYSISAGPHIRDLFGREMDQNGNGIAGESGVDAFTGTFSIASPAARPRREVRPPFKSPAWARASSCNGPRCPAPITRSRISATSSKL